MRSKVKAFTLFEVIIVLILFSIMFFFCGSLLNWAWHILEKNKESIVEDLENNLFYNDLSSQFLESKCVYWNATKHSLEFESDSSTRVNYVFNKGFVLRSVGMRVDTLKVLTIEPYGAFENEVQFSSGLIDEFKVKFVVKSDTLNANLLREYNAKTRLLIDK